MLDSGERFHLAIQEMQHGSAEKAIEHLKSCLLDEPENAKALYLLGALHAQIGMYDRSIEEMSQAVLLDNSLHIAKFQLGLLHFTAGNNKEAEIAWQGLDELGQENYLFLFKRGLLASTQNDFRACIEDLGRGIALNTDNEALNNDMRQMISASETALRDERIDTPSSDENITTPKQAPSLSAYKQDDD